MSFKITHGYNSEDFIEITKKELDKAYYCFLEKKDSVFSGGAIKGSNILMIKPDFHKVMGWNKGHKLDDYDFAEIRQKGIDKKMGSYLQQAKERVQYLISTNQTHLIGTDFEVPKIESPLSNEIKKLGDDKRIK